MLVESLASWTSFTLPTKRKLGKLWRIEEFSRERSGINWLSSKRGNVARDRIELPTRGFSVLCSTD